MGPDGGAQPLRHVHRAEPYPLFAEYAGGSIAFVDVVNQYLLPQAQYLPSALQGMTWSQVAAAMQPGGVCSSAGVTGAAGSVRRQAS